MVAVALPVLVGRVGQIELSGAANILGLVDPALFAGFGKSR